MTDTERDDGGPDARPQRSAPAGVMRGRLALGVAAAAVVVVAGTAPAAHAAAASVGGSVKLSPRQVATMTYANLTPAERIGQLFMAGVPSSGGSASLREELASEGVGNVILINGSNAHRKTIRGITHQLAGALRVAGVSPYISTDQEGGEVQRLTGRGFSTIPSALAQGRLTTAALRSGSATWGHQLAVAGVNLDLAPVADTVPKKHAKRNQPIGKFHREYGHTPAVVGPHVAAFVKGMTSAKVATTIKHFPGLGRASGNTDTTAGVTDPTTRHDAYLAPFREGVKAGTPFVMVSSATYPHIDPYGPACFSSTIMTSMLRVQLGFKGVVISDDLGTSALDALTPKGRAVGFFAAGGTMLLDTTASQLPGMIDSVRTNAAASPAFAATVQADVMTVLVAKVRAGLITG